MSAGVFGVTAGLVGLASLKQPQRGAMEFEDTIDVEAEVVEKEEPTLEALFQ